MSSDTFEELLTPCLALDASDRVERINQAAASWLAGTPRRLLGRHWNDLAPAAGPSVVDQARIGQRALHVRRQTLQALNGELRFANLWISPCDGDGGLQIELHPTEEFPGTDPVSALPAALHAALKGLAHEVKNPLAGLKGAAQLLARRHTDHDSARYIEVIRAESERLEALVDRLLDPAVPRPHQRMNVHVALEQVRLLAEAEAGWGTHIARDYDPSLPELLGDPDRLAQALWNLVRNALQSGASDVQLRSRAERGAVIGETHYRLAIRIDIADNGRGVPEDLAERIFLPLVSGRAEGSGLGLSLAQQVAREHRGSLAYRSRAGHTVFTLLLPVEDAGV